VAAGGESGDSGVFAAVDVCYLEAGRARAALVAARDQRFSSITWSRTVMTDGAASYLPGEFWQRELPPLQAVLEGVAGLALIIVDGYVDLDLGVPVIGVAKTFFRGAVHAVQVRRGRSLRPLYVTAAGMSVPGAASLVAGLAGPYRIPDALRIADRLARGLQSPVQPAAATDHADLRGERP
jgi:deoxyribonuclease V